MVKLSLTEFARLITQERDWAEWLKSPTSSDFPRCTDPPIHFLLLRRAGAVTVRRLNALSAGILSGIEGGATVHQLCEAVRDAIDIAVPEVEVEQVVLRTVVNAYEAGIITVTRQNGAARSTLRQ